MYCVNRHWPALAREEIPLNPEAYFKTQARDCRRLARELSLREDREAMLSLARHYDREADRARAAEPVPTIEAPLPRA
jgi:hypothetical protein